MARQPNLIIPRGSYKSKLLLSYVNLQRHHKHRARPSPCQLPQSRARGRAVGLSPFQFSQATNERQGHGILSVSAVPESGSRGRAAGAAACVFGADRALELLA
eukprot:3113293-Pyramimonas_sp.AAC.1